MRKTNFILGILLLLACCHLYAGDRSEQQMKEIAANALSSKTRRTANVAELKEFFSLSKLKVYGYDNGGFAVVTSDDKFESVIGISACTFEGPIPCGFKWWIESVNDVIEKSKGIIAPIVRTNNHRRSAGVGPLMTTKWGQGKPYNNKCRLTFNGKEYSLATGCVATAMAQIMN